MYQFDRNYAEAKLTIGAVEFTSSEYSIETIKITNGCYDGNAVGVGSVYIRHAEVTMERIRAVQKGTPISISFKVNDLWRGHGEYYVKEVPVVNGDKMTLQLQGILSKFEDIELVFSGGKQTYTLNDMKEQVESITGCQVVFLPPLSTEEKSTFLGRECCFLKDISTFVNGSDEATGVNVRSALSGLATLFGGNVYEEHGYIYIKSKTFHAADPSVISKDDISGDYSFSQLTYAVRSLNLSFLPWSITGMFNPPNTSSRIFTTGYQGNERVSNLLLGSQITDYTLYDYTIECDWLGWTSDGSKFDHYMTPGGRISACLRQGDLVYKSGTFNIIGYEITGQIKPGNIIKFEVQEETDPISIYCGEVTLEWDGGFKTTVSCNCNIEEGTASSSSGNSSALIRAAEQEAKINLYKLKFADIELSNIKDSTISGSIFKDGTIDGSKIKDSTITGSLIADSTIKGSNIEEGTITGSKIKAATITGALIVDGTIRGNHIMESNIDGSKIEDSAITESKISNSSITNSKIKDGEIENAKIKDSTLTGAKIKDATIGFEKVDSSFIKDLTADKAYIENLKASIADIGYLTAGEADIKYATIASLEVVDGKINNLETIAITTNNLSAKVADLGYLNADTANLAYAKIDLSNVGSQVVSSSMIIDGAVTNEKVANLSANKITSGTIDASKITVTNLNADNLTVGTINGQRIGAGSLSLDKLAEEVPTKEYLDSVEKNLNGEITGIKSFDSEISSWKVDTDSELSSLKTRTESLETDLGDKVSSTVFNEVKQTVDKNSASIMTLSDTVKSKADGSTVEALTNTVNEVKQTADSNSSSISSMQTEIGKKADGSIVTELSTKTSSLEQNLDGFKTEVSKTYTTKTEFDDLSIGGRNMILNSNFELPGKPNWDGLSAYAYITDEGRNGGYCAKQIGKFNKDCNLVNLVDSSRNKIKIKANDILTFSGWYKVKDYVAGTTNNFVRPYLAYFNNNDWLGETAILDISPDATDWTYVQASFKVPDIKTIDNMEFTLYARDYTGIIWWDDIKLEKGNKATDWSPAPEDLESDSSAKADAALQSAKSYTDQTAESINQVVSKKVGDSEIISKINQSAEQITISADKLNLSGYLTISGADAKYDEKGSAKSIKDNIYTPNTTTIDGGKITTNSIKASSIDVDNLFAQDITATGTITGATLKGVTAEIDAGKIGPLSIASDDRNLRFDLSDSYYLRIGGQIYGKGINIFDNSGFTQVIYSSSGIWMRDEKDAGWDTVITPSRITIGDFIHGTSTEGFEINIPMTVNDNLTVTDTLNTYKMETTAGIEMYHSGSTPYIDFHNTPYGQQDGSDYNFRIISLDKNVLDFENAHGSIFKIHGTEAYENGYEIIGCKVTISGNFTCKKYRDGRLVIEYKKILTSKLSLSNTDWSGIHYAQAEYAYKYFPVGFTETPSVTSGIAIADLTCPFCTLTIEQITKSYFVRAIVWTIGDISSYELPVGTVISATFTGRWK